MPRKTTNASPEASLYLKGSFEVVDYKDVKISTSAGGLVTLTNTKKDLFPKPLSQTNFIMEL